MPEMEETAKHRSEGWGVGGHLMSGDEKEGSALVVKEQQPTNSPEALWCGAMAWGIICCRFVC